MSFPEERSNTSNFKFGSIYYSEDKENLAILSYDGRFLVQSNYCDDTQGIFSEYELKEALNRLKEYELIGYL